MRDAVAGALEDYGHAVDVDGLVFEEGPGDLTGTFSWCRETGRMSGDQEYGEDAGSGCEGGPYSDRCREAVAVEECS